jgi:hypothetical protein
MKHHRTELEKYYKIEADLKVIQEKQDEEVTMVM